MEVAHVPRRAALKCVESQPAACRGQVQRVNWRNAALVAGAVMGSRPPFSSALQPEEGTRCNIRMNAFDRGKVERFATLPPGEAYPEGIDADAEGNVYVVTVGANKPDTSPGSLFVFDPNGKLLRTVHTEGTSPWLLDLRFQPNTGKLLVVDYQNPKVFAVDPKTGATSVFMTVTGEHPGLDGLTFDADGNVYVTDAHQGIIWRVGKEGGVATAWVMSPLLKPTRPPRHRRKRPGVQQRAHSAVRRQHRARHYC
jgi:hypothetical protein